MEGLNPLTMQCTYSTPCGWCAKWDKKCDKKIGCGTSNKIESHISIKDYIIPDSVVEEIIEDVINKERITNKTCQSEEDHVWECCGMSTEGSDYRCKKCGKYKFAPYTASTSNYYKGD